MKIIVKNTGMSCVVITLNGKGFMSIKPNILIVSMARCGSSAIFEMIKDSCEGEKIAFFEPSEQDFFSKVLPFS